MSLVRLLFYARLFFAKRCAILVYVIVFVYSDLCNFCCEIKVTKIIYIGYDSSTFLRGKFGGFNNVNVISIFI